MSEDTLVPAGEPEEKRGFALPSAYTILFVLIVLAAIATWVIPVGTYDLNEEGEPVPGTHHEVDAEPARILVDCCSSSPASGPSSTGSATRSGHSRSAGCET